MTNEEAESEVGVEHQGSWAQNKKASILDTTGLRSIIARDICGWK